MTRFSRSWPLGLNRFRNASLVALGLVVAIVLLHVLDRPLSAWGQGLDAPVRAFFRWMTQWGESDWILIPSLKGLLLVWLFSLLTLDDLRAAARELAGIFAFIFLGVGLPSLASTLLKRFIGRGRPTTWSEEVPLAFLPNWDKFDYQSFPSGHATTAFSLALVLTFLWPRAFWLALLFAVLVALSRIVLGAHYPTDVLAGAALGSLGAYAVRYLFAARGRVFAFAPDGTIVRRPFSALGSVPNRDSHHG